MTISMEYDGTINWYRTDSFWNPTATVMASSWGPMHGPGLNSSHWWSAADNTVLAATTTDGGKSYVFALSDGTGVQIAHLTGGAGLVNRSSAYQTAGTGSNTLTSAATVFTNVAPNRVTDNFCADTNLLLAGQADTSTLPAAVTAYSDGYKATITMALDMVMMGAAGGWRGVCMVYYTSQYIQDNTNGAVCMSAVQSTSGFGTDLGSVVLSHVPAATWQPPAASGSFSPTGSALTDAKYGIVHSPATTA